MWRKCKEAPVRSVPDGLACCATRPHARAAATENRDASSFGDQILTRRPHVTYRTKIAASTQGLTATLDNMLSLFVILDMPATGMPTAGKKWQIYERCLHTSGIRRSKASRPTLVRTAAPT